jgi:uncharacterized protein YkwD
MRILALSIILSVLLSMPAFAQVKKTTKVTKTTTVTKTITYKKTPVAKTPAVKRTATVKVVKPVSKKKTVAVVKEKPVKPPVNRNISIAECNMSDREKQMVEEINLVRSNPSAYAKYVKEYIKHAEDMSKDTKAAASELITELKKTKPLAQLAISPALYVDAREYGKEMQEKNVIAHSTLPYNENLSFGIESIRDAVIDLLIDDGVDDRGHRKNILKKNITLCAVHEVPGKVEDFQFCYIQEFK